MATALNQMLSEHIGNIAFAPIRSAASEHEAQVVRRHRHNLWRLEPRLARLRRNSLQIAQSQAEPDRPRIRLLGRNICTLAEHICTIAARYPAGDPIAATCADGRGRCARAKEIVQQKCSLPAE